MAEYTTPLTAFEVRHLLRRTGFGAFPSEVTPLVGKTAGSVVDDLLDAATSISLPAPRIWSLIPPLPRNATQAERNEYTVNNRNWREELQVQWMGQMGKNRFRERLTLFWHDHFVTSYLEYNHSTYGYRYLNLLRSGALGNFKDLVHAIGIDAAMLIYLDGRINNGNAPNENYARELLELFTMGPLDLSGAPNYTESDIQEIAKALSGWVLLYPTSWDVRFNYPSFDDGPKTFFGRTGEFGYDYVINILFEERTNQIADFIASKLVSEFVYRDPDPVLVASVASALKANNFEIKPALRVLFTDVLFFDPKIMGGRQKSPVEFCVGLVVDANSLVDEVQADYIVVACSAIDQSLLNPPNVAGWPGHRDWITTNTLATRWTISDSIARRYTDPSVWLSLGELLTPAGSTHPSVDLALALARHMFALPLEWVEVPQIEEPFEGDLANRPLPDWLVNGPAFQQNLVKIFLNGLPWYEWNLSIGGASDRLVSYVISLSQFPEYQLM